MSWADYGFLDNGVTGTPALALEGLWRAVRERAQLSHSSKWTYLADFALPGVTTHRQYGQMLRLLDEVLKSCVGNFYNHTKSQYDEASGTFFPGWTFAELIASAGVDWRDWQPGAPLFAAEYFCQRVKVLQLLRYAKIDRCFGCYNFYTATTGSYAELPAAAAAAEAAEDWPSQILTNYLQLTCLISDDTPNYYTYGSSDFCLLANFSYGRPRTYNVYLPLPAVSNWIDQWDTATLGMTYQPNMVVNLGSDTLPAGEQQGTVRFGANREIVSDPGTPENGQRIFGYEGVPVILLDGASAAFELPSTAS